MDGCVKLAFIRVRTDFTSRLYAVTVLHTVDPGNLIETGASLEFINHFPGRQSADAGPRPGFSPST
jgi:hypothetical protein